MSVLEQYRAYDEMETELGKVLYAGTYLATKALGKLVLGVKVTGRENIPDSGAALFASNHRHWLDIFYLPYAVDNRHLSMVARDDIGNNHPKLKPLIDWYFNKGEVLFIKRGQSSADQLRAISDRLEDGRAVGIFPEESRGDTQMRRLDPRVNLDDFRKGVASLARMNDAPTYPVAIGGMDHAFTKDYQKEAFINVGGPMDPAGKGHLAREFYINELRNRIALLYEAGPSPISLPT